MHYNQHVFKIVGRSLLAKFFPPTGGRAGEGGVFFFATPVFGGQGPRSGDVTTPWALGSASS